MHQINMQLPVQGDFLDFPAESLHDFFYKFHDRRRRLKVKYFC